MNILDLERTWFEVWSFLGGLGGSGGSVLGDEPTFGMFKVWNFKVCSNTRWKFYPFFDILCRKNLWFGSRFSLFWEVWRFEVWYQRMNLGSEGLRFSFLKVREV